MPWDLAIKIRIEMLDCFFASSFIVLRLKPGIWGGKSSLSLVALIIFFLMDLLAKL